MLNLMRKTESGLQRADLASAGGNSAASAQVLTWLPSARSSRPSLSFLRAEMTAKQTLSDGLVESRVRLSSRPGLAGHQLRRNLHAAAFTPIPPPVYPQSPPELLYRQSRHSPPLCAFLD